jgi:hypothetical protein
VIKLYKRDADGALLYHESWVDPSEGKVAVHWGRVGERGEVRYSDLPDGADHDACIGDALTEARGQGFAELSEHDHNVIEVQYDLDQWGGADDLDLRNAIDELLNEELGWHGVGEWLGSSMGSGQMEIAYMVVDAEIATEVITAALEQSEFPMFSRINITDADDFVLELDPE